MTDPRDYDLIPQTTLDSLHEYVRTGRPVGHFLTAVLANDLFKACAHADHRNTLGLVALVTYIYNRCPMGCHGGYDAVKEWHHIGGTEGL